MSYQTTKQRAAGKMYLGNRSEMKRKKKYTSIPLANLRRRVLTRKKAESSVAPMRPIKAWVITVTPNVENPLKMAGPAMTHIFLFSLHICFPTLSSSSSSSALDDPRSLSLRIFSISCFQPKCQNQCNKY